MRSRLDNGVSVVQSKVRKNGKNKGKGTMSSRIVQGAGCQRTFKRERGEAEAGGNRHIARGPGVKKHLGRLQSKSRWMCGRCFAIH